MFERILIAVDGSDLADEMARAVVPLFRRPGSQAVLVRVVPPTLGDSPAGVNPFQVAKHHLQRLAFTLPAGDPPVASQVLVGDPATEILAEAQRAKAGLIVLATHGREGASRWLHGSVAETVLRQAPCPVVVADPRKLARKELRLGRILVPLDGSALAAEALASAVELAKASPEAELVLFHALGLTIVLDPAPSASPVRTREEGIALLGTYRERVEGVRVRTEVALGEAAPAVVEAARALGVDLVVMTTHGRTGLGRALFGSVAEAVLRHSPCPVLVKRASRVVEASRPAKGTVGAPP